MGANCPWIEEPRLPGDVACITAGDEWAARAASALLRVPSAVVPGEENSC